MIFLRQHLEVVFDFALTRPALIEVDEKPINRCLSLFGIGILLFVPFCCHLIA